MSRYTFPGGRRAPAPERGTPSSRFDGYPYLVSRIGQSALRHVALVPAGWSRERVVATARAQAAANGFETVACFGPGDAVSVSCDDARSWQGSTPAGIFVTGRLLLPEPLPATEELAIRQARLLEFDLANRPGGYLVGDGTDHGVRAESEDRVVAGRGPDGLPTGLRRCPKCGRAAGDYLRGGVEIVRIRCACENLNRCARCLTPLAAHCLSAWFWDEESAQAWHLAAYAAFSHHCPGVG
jgi:hypothetical protein